MIIAGQWLASAEKVGISKPVLYKPKFRRKNMKCKRCGRNNPPGNNKCSYCNTSLHSQNVNDSAKRENGIVVIIAILFLVLLVLIFIYFTGCNSNSSGSGFGIGGGGGGVGIAGLYPGDHVQPGVSNGDNGNSGTDGENGSGNGNNGSGNGNNGGVNGSGVEIVEGEDGDESGSSSSGSSSSGSSSSGSSSSGSGSSGSGSSGSGSSGSGSSSSGSSESGEAVGAQAQRERFLRRADEIEEYADEYLSNAQSQVEINNQSEIVFKKWDYLLNEIYQFLEVFLTDEEFAALEADEIEWIKEKEAAMQQAREDWEGGSGMAMAVNMVGIDYTMSRCYYLIDMLPAN